MIRTIGVICLATVMWGWQSDKATLNPVGKWNYSTLNDQGNPTTGIIEIAGKAGAYSGRIVTSQGRELPLTDVLTSRDVMLLIADLPDGGGAAVIKVIKSANGSYSGHWGAVRTVIPAKVERATQP